MANTHSLDLEASSSQYASITDGSQTGLDVTGDFTIEAWIKPESLTDFDVIVSKDNVGVSRSYALHLKADGALHAYVFGTGGSGQVESESTAGIISTGTWYHVAMVFDVTADTIDLYLNGTETGYQIDSSGTVTSVTDSSAPFSIGSRQNSGTEEKFYDGLIDDVRFWNDKRTSTEISDNYNVELNGDEAGLVGQWKLNNDYLDATSNNNDLTASGSPVFSTDASPSGSGTANTQIKAYWKLENVNDSFGSYTLTNTASTTFTAGKIDNAATFNGSSQALNNASIWGATSYPRSYAGWVKFDTVAAGGDQSVFAIGDGSVHYYTFKLRDSDDELVFRSNNTTQSADVDTGITAVADTWYHIAVVQHSATSVSLYVDGTKTNTTASTYSATVDDFYIGYLGRSSVWWLDGQVDEVGFWDKALTDENVTELYNGGDGQQYPFTGVSSGLTAGTGAFTLTGVANSMTLGWTLDVETGIFNLTGNDVGLVFKGWTHQTKNTASWTEESKNSASWTEESKNSTSWTTETKN
jgi:hypothetical protein